ncbi:DUF5071 domain-containing protein [Vannielia litorea]|uniref:DUF5071 domain-containing protein n=1 Tax=Vannielia litorea TaxID=1217970 RepID=UPI001BCD91AF|nr:DUF5071 domain-containing protein [Vannielia litorea]
MEPHPCLPTDKHDVEAVRRAAALSPVALEPLLPDLLEWLQDANWPVASPVADCLAGAGPALLPPLRRILRGDDGAWKYWLLELLPPRLPAPLFEALRPEIERLASAPTPEDRREEVHLAARGALAAAPG